MSAVALLCILLALATAVLLWRYVVQRRELQDVNRGVAAAAAHRHRRLARGPRGIGELEAGAVGAGHGDQPSADARRLPSATAAG